MAERSGKDLGIRKPVQLRTGIDVGSDMRPSQAIPNLRNGGLSQSIPARKNALSLIGASNVGHVLSVEYGLPVSFAACACPGMSVDATFESPRRAPLSDHIFAIGLVSPRIDVRRVAAGTDIAGMPKDFGPRLRRPVVRQAPSESVSAHESAATYRKHAIPGIGKQGKPRPASLRAVSGINSGPEALGLLFWGRLRSSHLTSLGSMVRGRWRMPVRHGSVYFSIGRG